MTAIEAYESLTQKEKEAINILAMNMIKFYPIHERPKSKELLQRVRSEKLTKKFLDEIIEKMQLSALKNEIARIKIEKRKRQYTSSDQKKKLMTEVYRIMNNKNT